MVQVGESVCKRHEDQLRPRQVTVGEIPQTQRPPLDIRLNLPSDLLEDQTQAQQSDTPTTITEQSPPELPDIEQPIPITADPLPLSSPVQPRRNPPRNRKPPQRYGDERYN